MNAMDARLTSISMNVEWFTPKSGNSNILHEVVQRTKSHELVCFIHGLGTQSLQYEGLNLYREVLVDQRLKLILWLTLDEVTVLSQKAPDFWAFRTRMIEFPTKRNSRKNNLPSGILLWHRDIPSLKMNAVLDEIGYYKTLIQNMPSQGETVTTRANAIANLAHCYWITGENNKVFDLLYQEIELIRQFQLNELHSILLNALSINLFDQKVYLESLRWIEQALELNPSSSLLWSNFGIICRSAGQSRKSLPSLKKAIRLDPASPESCRVMGFSYMSLGKYELALPLFEKALALHPENFHYYPALAICHSHMGNTENFNQIVQKITYASGNDEYLALCRDGLLGNEATVDERLRRIVLGEKPMQLLIRRDPVLRFILSPTAFQGIFDERG